MQKLWNYECRRCVLTFEAWAENGVPAPCPQCGETTTQNIGSVGVSLPDPGFPTAWFKWADRHERKEEPGTEY